MFRDRLSEAWFYIDTVVPPNVGRYRIYDFWDKRWYCFNRQSLPPVSLLYHPLFVKVLYDDVVIAIIFDWDYDADMAFERLARVGLRPDIVVKTLRGYHTVHLLRQPIVLDLGKFRTLCRELGADDAAVRLCGVAVPGTRSCKDPNFFYRITFLDIVYSGEVLRHELQRDS